MKTITLTRQDGSPVRVNPDRIVYYHGMTENAKPVTYVELSTSALRVKETSKQVDEKIAELPTPKWRARSLFEEIFGPTGGTR